MRYIIYIIKIYIKYIYQKNWLLYKNFSFSDKKLSINISLS